MYAAENTLYSVEIGIPTTLPVWTYAGPLPAWFQASDWGGGAGHELGGPNL